jgi:hypothetical protein
MEGTITNLITFEISSGSEMFQEGNLTNLAILRIFRFD